ncbi:MAG TPA: AAA family ATPase [Chloroflexota bacterium]|nr:AAA family ATPase [Chloroflexota bacterium]
MSAAQGVEAPRAVAPVADAARRVREAVGRVIVGLDEAVELLLVALLVEGHVLLEDVPGVGKTLLARTLARALGCGFRRLQFTPDLLPSDVTGLSYFNQKVQEFEFRPGPIFTNVLLADEINRATPRTQSALLEAMEERQVTVEGETRVLARPFLVLATQNPVELEGTFPLPEAQLDRFLMRVSLGYPDEAQERAILRRFREIPSGAVVEGVEPVLDGAALGALQAACRAVHVGQPVEGYLLSVVRATRGHEGLDLGASPRASLALYRACQALAALRGREYVLPDDVKRLAPSVLGHRLLPTAQSRLRGRGATAVVEALLQELPVPVEMD